MALFEDVALLEEVCHWGAGLEVSKAQARPNDSLFLLSADSEVELSAPSLAPHFPACCDTSQPDNELNL